MDARKQSVVAGLCCIGIGLSVCFIGLGIIPYEEDGIHAPVWVIVVAGSVFVLGGLAVVFRSRPILVSVLGNLIVIAFASVGAWIALAGPAEQFSGGIPFLSHDRNVAIGRYVFAIGSLLCLLMLIPGVSYLRQQIAAVSEREQL